ncbi:endopeptidase La [bacterium]|nr:endopeptidase La [bacterium]
MAAKKKVTKRKTTKVSKKKTKANTLPLLPLRDIVIFPHMVVPFFVGRERSVNALEAAMQGKLDILLCAQKNSDLNEPTAKDIYMTGTIASVVQLVKLPDGTLKVLVEGQQRAKVKKIEEVDEYFTATIEVIEDKEPAPLQSQALMRSLKQSFEAYVKLNKQIPPELLMSMQNIEESPRLVDSIVSHLSLRLEDKQSLLELEDTLKRMEKLLSILESEIEILRVEKRIRSRVRKQMERGQKEYYLNEQMAAIQKELGERDEFKAEIAEIEQKLRENNLSNEAKEKGLSELKKLKMMSPMSSEATVIRLYLDWLVELPWKKETTDNLDLDHAKEVLEEDHYGLDKIKERILEFISVRQLNPDMKAPILCFVGPPGVGKTSLAGSIAKAIERKFVRISLGGVRDESEVRGHRRTYIGAMPGKIIQSVKKADSRNPLFLLDEIDKMGSDFRGDPASAMLEVLDPAQNHTFADHYLEVDFDLSKVIFIATANSLSGIPQPLLDRMELIELSSYTEIEKLQIAKRHLIPKAWENHALDKINASIEDGAIVELLHHYTREAGVRNLEREISKIARKIAKKYLESGEKKSTIKVTKNHLLEFLGPRRYKYGMVEKIDNIGTATGLAWTSVGGDTLAIEVSILPGKGKITITGKLGDVMQESAQAAYSYVRSRAERLGLPRDFYQRIDIHIHVPEGATPKDGPSAGITIATALTSALTEKPVRKDLAMTGEITLRGHVLEIGGLKEKLLAAHRAGIRTVVIPMDNAKDLYDVPKEILDQIEVIPVSHVDQVLRMALVLGDDDPLITELGQAQQAYQTPRSAGRH